MDIALWVWKVCFAFAFFLPATLCKRGVEIVAVLRYGKFFLGLIIYLSLTLYIYIHTLFIQNSPSPPSYISYNTPSGQGSPLTLCAHSHFSLFVFPHASVPFLERFHIRLHGNRTRVQHEGFKHQVPNFLPRQNSV